MTNEFKPTETIKEMIAAFQDDLDQLNYEKELWKEVMTDSEEDKELLKELTVQSIMLKGLVDANKRQLALCENQ